MFTFASEVWSEAKQVHAHLLRLRTGTSYTPVGVEPADDLSLPKA